MSSPDPAITVLLAGDVMTGRGIDQALPHASADELREPHVRSARDYLELARRAHGPVEPPLAPEDVWGDLLEVMKDASWAARVVNLETSVTTSDDFWPDKGIHYRMHPGNVDVLRVAALDVCSLANNHVMDFSRAGLRDTLESLRSAKVQCAGAGPSLEAARAPARVEGPAGAVLVFAAGHASSGIPDAWRASSERSGVHLLPELSVTAAEELADHVNAHRSEEDVAIVSIHWGDNWGWDVPRDQVLFARRLVERGVDVVHGHSSHHVRPVELHQGKVIFYGVGDLITDYEGIGGHESYRGDLGALYAVTLKRADRQLAELRLIPTQMRRFRLRRPGADDVRWLAEELDQLSRDRGLRFEASDDGAVIGRAT